MTDGLKNYVDILRMNVILMLHLLRLYVMASILEKHRKATKRRMSKDGLTMIMYMQFKNHQHGWFTHREGILYALLKIFVKEVLRWLQISFPNVLKNLDKNLLNESLSSKVVMQTDKNGWTNERMDEDDGCWIVRDLDTLLRPL